MLDDADLTNSNEVERIRRSVAMLPANTGKGVFTRAEALRLVAALKAALSAAPLDSGLE